MKTNKKQICIILLAALTSMSAMSFADESADNAAAQNNSQAQKMTMSMGEVNVNARTGDVDFQVKLPQFGGLDMSIKYSNMFGFSAAEGNPTFLSMPQGAFISGLPFIHEGNDGNKVLFFSGSDYYISDIFSSIDESGKQYKSGIRYMTNKMMRFHDYSGTPQTMFIENKLGKETEVSYSYMLEYKTGVTYYFNAQGLCVAVTDAYFMDSVTANYKHLTRIDYDNPKNTPDLAKIKSITDAQGSQVLFDYQDGHISINYPAGANHDFFQTMIALSGNQATAIKQSLNGQYDTGFSLMYGAQGLLSNVVDTLFDKGTFNKPKGYLGNKLYQFNYSDDRRVLSRSVGALTASGLLSDTKKMTQFYRYLGSSQNTFKYGADTSMDMPNVPMNKVQYVTEEQVGNQVVVHSYNFLHQEITTNAKYYDSNNKLHMISSSYNIYPNLVNASTNSIDRKLKTNYADPTKSITVIYDNDQPVSITQSISKFNDYDQNILTKKYPAVAFKQKLKESFSLNDSVSVPDYPQDVKPLTEDVTQYDENHLLVKLSSKKTDFTTGEILENSKVLDPLYRHPVQETESYGNMKTNSITQGKTLNYEYATDSDSCANGGNLFDASMKCKETITYGGDKDNFVSKLYKYDAQLASSSQYPKITTTTTREAQDKLGVIPTVSSSEISVGGKTIKSVDASGIAVAMQYDVKGNLLQKQTGDGKIETNDYDYINRTAIEEITPSNGSGKDKLLNKKQIYDFMGNVVSSFDRNQKADGSKSTLETNRSVYDYSDGPRVIKKIDDYGNETRMTYDNRGEVIKKEDYHEMNNQNGLLQLQKIGETTRDYHFVCDAEYGCYQKVIETKDNENNTGLKTVSYIRGKRADKKNEPAVIFSETTLVKDGSIVKKEKSNYTETGVLLGFEKYDNEDNLTNKKVYHYDGKGRKDRELLSSFKVGVNVPAHQYTLDHQYDDWNDNKEVATILSSPNENGRFQGYTKYYDIVGRKVKTCYTLSGQEHCTRAQFDDADRQILGIDFNGNTMTQEYNPQTGDLQKQVYLDSQKNSQDVISYQYNGFGLISKSMQNDNGISYFYNKIGLPLYLDYGIDSKTILKGTQTNITYDEHNQVVEMTDSNGFRFNNHYLVDGRNDYKEVHNSNGVLMGSIKNSFYDYADKENPQRAGKLKQSESYFNDGNITNTQTTSYQYDLQGREFTKTMSDLLGNKTVINTSYDSNNNISSLVYVDRSSVKPDDANINKIVNYKYDDLSRVIASTTDITVPNGKWTKDVITYNYDINGNILDEVETITGQNKITKKASHYTYDEIDQLLTKEEVIKDNDQLISDKKLSYKYDNNGNMTEILDGNSNSEVLIAKYTYNPQNQMTGFTDVAHNSLKYNYGYYPGGHRQSKSDGKQTIKFYYDNNGHMLNEALINAQGDLIKMSSLFGPFRYLLDK